MTQQQDSEAQADRMDVVAGLIFPPFLLGLVSDKDRKEELSRLIGEYEAVRSVAFDKGCIDDRGQALAVPRSVTGKYKMDDGKVLELVQHGLNIYVNMIRCLCLAL